MEPVAARVAPLLHDLAPTGLTSAARPASVITYCDVSPMDRSGASHVRATSPCVTSVSAVSRSPRKHQSPRAPWSRNRRSRVRCGGVMRFFTIRHRQVEPARRRSSRCASRLRSYTARDVAPRRDTRCRAGDAPPAALLRAWRRGRLARGEPSKKCPGCVDRSRSHSTGIRFQDSSSGAFTAWAVSSRDNT